MNRLARRFAALAIAALTGLAAPAGAQTLGMPGGSGEPIYIEADDGIEWLRDEQRYVARGNARAAQGGVTVEADELSALYREVADGGTEIYRFDATGNVRILSDAEMATGDAAVYDVAGRTFVLTGEEVRLDTAEDTIFARDRLEYYEAERTAVARGDARAVRDDSELRADELWGFFTEKAAAGGTDTDSEAGGSSKLDRLAARGNVVITTEREVILAERGDYDLNTRIATLTGNVRITRDDNQLNGETAEVNLATGVSRLIGPSGGDGRVRGLFLPQPAAPDESADESAGN